MRAAAGLMTLVPVVSRLVLPEHPAVPGPAPAAVETRGSGLVWWKPVFEARGLQEPTVEAPVPADELPPPVPADELPLPPPVPADELPPPPPVPAEGVPPPEPMEPTPKPGPAEAVDDTMDQLYGIIMEANITFNKLEDMVSQVTEKAMGFLATLDEAADEASAEGAHEAATEVGDKLVVLITDMQDTVSPSRDKLLTSIQKQASAVAKLRPDVVSTFNTATEKVAALEECPTAFLQVKQAQAQAQAWWPFPWGHHHTKDCFDVAEDAVNVANKTVTKVADELAAAKDIAIESMSELVLDKIKAATQTFQEKCELTVVAQGKDMPEILGMQAMTVCNSARSVESDVSTTVSTYEQRVYENIAAAEESVQGLYDSTGELMDKVDAARAAAETAED